MLSAPQLPDTPGPGRFFPANIPPDRRAHLLMRYLSLTSAQADIAVHLADGLTVKEIAACDGRATTTVKGHLEQVKWRLGTRNGAQVAALVAAVLWCHAERTKLSGGGGGKRVLSGGELRPGLNDPGHLICMANCFSRT